MLKTLLLLFPLVPLQLIAQCAPPPPNLPSPPCANFTFSGFIGKPEVISGNCDILTLPPLAAFGTLMINQNPPMGSVNRLNPQQKPSTNDFQNFQNACSINQLTTWTDSSTPPFRGVGGSNGSADFKVRSGPFLVGMTRTGPGVTIPAYNFNTMPVSGVYLPALVTSSNITVFFGAAEVDNPPSTYFNIATAIPTSETCVITYTPINPALSGKFLKDYNITGSAFHDVFYSGLTPVIACGEIAVSNGGAPTNGILISVDGGALQYATFGSTVTGNSFQLYVLRAAPLAPMTFLICAVGNPFTPVSFTVSPDVNSHFLLNGTGPFTGFIRLAALSSQDFPVAGSPPSQQTFFMPESLNSFSPTAPCGVEGPTPPCPNVCSYNAQWPTLAGIQSLSQNGLTFYELLPYANLAPTPPPPSKWVNLFTDLAEKQMGAHWTPTLVGTCTSPNPTVLTEILPVIAEEDYPTANQYLTDFYNFFNPAPPPPFKVIYTGIRSSNYFALQFDMLMATNSASAVSAFQAANRTLPSYTITSPVDNVGVYLAQMRYIPVQADVFFDDNSHVRWNYTTSPDVPPPGGNNNVLVCFPFWKQLSTPATPQNFIYNDVIKGTLYAAIATNSGDVTFTEPQTRLPTWFLNGDMAIGPATGNSLYIPAGLTFNGSQQATLDFYLSVLPVSDPPYPYFSDDVLNDLYDGGKQVYMLAKTGLYIAYYLFNVKGQTLSQAVAASQPYIDNAKSILTNFIVTRSYAHNFFNADQLTGGICTEKGGGNGTDVLGPNLQHNVNDGADFFNYIYTDHHFNYGYYLQTAALITEWELNYAGTAPANVWVNIPVLGADYNTYAIRDMVDFLWRDVHNPFKANIGVVVDPDLPYDRQGLPWEGHSVANGLGYGPNDLGRNQESLSEDFNCWVGINTYARRILQVGGNPIVYDTVRDFSYMNLKLNASSGIMWYKDYAYWNEQSLVAPAPPATSLNPAIYIGQYSFANVTTGQVNDTSAQGQTFFGQ